MKGDICMGLLAKWREKHPKKLDPFDAEAKRLQDYLATVQCGTEEYRAIQKDFLTNATMREQNRESRKKLDKQGRASVWTKIIGGVGTLLGIGALGYYEMKGNTFSGEKRKLADGLTNIICNLFRNGRS